MTSQRASPKKSDRTASLTIINDKIICGDALTVLKRLPSESVDACVTSPPYFHLRDFGVAGQIGLEATLEEYLARLVAVFDEIKRVLKPSGTCWVNLGDTYGGSSSFPTSCGKRSPRLRPRKQNWFLPADVRTLPFSTHTRGSNAKSLLQVPSRFALLMTARGWILRNEIIWHKPNCTPSSVKDRFTVDFEKIYFFVKNRRYRFEQQFEPVKDAERLARRYFNPNTLPKWHRDKLPNLPVNREAIEKSRRRMIERGRNMRAVWRIGTGSYAGDHFAVYPPALIATPIRSGCPAGGIVLDPFLGSGTTALVAKRLGRRFVGIELNPEYVKMARERLVKVK
jgi:DNA modification methylase